MIALIAAAALAGSVSTIPPQSALQPWSYLVGHCWVGDAPQGGGRDKHCFESIYGGQHVRDRHSVTRGGREVYAGESLYSVQGPKVIFTYWNSIGGVGTGEAAYAGDGWRFSGSIRATPASAEEHFTAEWEKTAGGYEVRDVPGARPRLFKRAD